MANLPCAELWVVARLLPIPRLASVGTQFVLYCSINQTSSHQTSEDTLLKIFNYGRSAHSSKVADKQDVKVKPLGHNGNVSSRFLELAGYRKLKKQTNKQKKPLLPFDVDQMSP